MIDGSHWSLTSSHSSVAGSQGSPLSTQPRIVSQFSWPLQNRPSSQISGFPGRQPSTGSQVSIPSQTLPLLQTSGVPSWQPEVALQVSIPSQTLLSVHFASLGVKTHALAWQESLVQATPSLHTQSDGQLPQSSQLASHKPSPQSDSHTPPRQVKQSRQPQSDWHVSQVSQRGSHASSPQVDSQTPMLHLSMQS